MNDIHYNIDENQKNVVYSPTSLVSDMVDLVRDEADRIDSRFLEPACGDGNFLVAILNRKFENVGKKYSHSRLDFEFYLFRSIMSLYGIEIESEARHKCILRMLVEIKNFYLIYYDINHWQKIEPRIRFVLETNIILGDALSLKSPVDDKPIVFAEWSFFGCYRVKRRDFIYEHLIDESINSEMVISDEQKISFIPKAIKEYPIVKISNLI